MNGIWVFLIILLVVQVIGLMTFLHFNSKMKKLSRDNKRMKSIISSSKEETPMYKKMGLTEKEYEDCMSSVYGMTDSQIRLYDPYALQATTDTEGTSTNEDEENERNENDLFEIVTNTTNDGKAEPNLSEEEEDEDDLSQLLGIDDPEELKKLQTQIEGSKKKPQEDDNFEPDEIEPVGIEMDEDDLDQLSKDLDAIIQAEENAKNQNVEPKPIPPMEEAEPEPIPPVEEPEPIPPTEDPEIEPIPLEEPQPEEEAAPNKKSKRKKTTMGEGEDLFNELVAALGEENPTDEAPKEEPLFSEEDVPPIPEEEIVFQMNDEIPITDEDIPFLSEEDEQSKMVNMLNLLDKETTRLENEIDSENNTDIENQKRVLAERIASLADEGEGKKNMKQIAYALYELYQLEGKEEDMQAIKEEYKEYFSDEPINLRIFEEDIIRVDKKRKDPFELPEKYLWIATNSVADGKEGEQRWIGKCIGKNQNYIHFRDMSQRIWINVGQRIDQINNGDLLAVFVEREGESITAKEVLTLKEVADENLNLTEQAIS